MKMNMLDYIRETPSVLIKNIERRAELTDVFVHAYLESGKETITIVADGSSYNGAVCAQPFMEKIMGTRVRVVRPFTYLHYTDLPELDGFTVVVSQSGASTNAIDAMEEARRRTGIAIGITGCTESEMGRKADILIEYGVGVETVGWVTKGELTLDLFCKLCALGIAEEKGKLSAADISYWLDQLRRAAEAGPKMEKMAVEFIDRHAKYFTSMLHAYIMGAGPSYGIALEGALKNGETTQFPVYAYEMEAFLHGPNYQLTPNHNVFLIDCDPRTHDRVMQIASACECVTDRVFVISSLAPIANDGFLKDHTLSLDIEIDPYVSSFALLPFFQVSAYEMATRLNRWERHPLFPPFRYKCGSKTIEYLNKKD